jgi:hypothetical protein
MKNLIAVYSLLFALTFVGIFSPVSISAEIEEGEEDECLDLPLSSLIQHP